MSSIPKHIAIIMDGNGRWAQEQNLPRVQGHAKGADTVDDIVEASLDLGVKFLTLYAFSIENWNRPDSEVAFLMSFLGDYLDRQKPIMMERGIRFGVIGRTHLLSDSLQNKINEITEQTKDHTNLTLTIALSYGARAEIVDAAKRICVDVQNSRIEVDSINEELFSNYLYNPSLPDPDLLIRTSGEERISNFLLWQISYSELYFIEKYWPDFNKEDYAAAIKCYSERQRRFGEV